MINGKLHDFATSARARGQISFGDVRRLQRDCLPQGITTRDEAESLIALNATLVRADKAWAAWLVPALAEFATAQQGADAAGADATKAWLHGLLAQCPATATLGRKIARHIRRLTPPAAGGSCEAPSRPRRKVPTCKAARVVRSGMMVRKTRRATAQRDRAARRTTYLPCELWSAGIMEKHLRFQLARPAA